MICKKEANPIRKNAVKQFVQQHSFYVGVSGLEPEKAGPESAVLPLHHTPYTILSSTKGQRLRNLLGYPDSNQERQDQNLQCYHYTIPQT